MVQLFWGGRPWLYEVINGGHDWLYYFNQEIWNFFSQFITNTGDFNGDGEINVLAIINIVNLILSDEYNIIGDLNNDIAVNAVDIIQLVNIILSY